MNKQKIDTSKPHMNIGTIGHVDHGKTTLTASILYILNLLGLAEKKDYSEIDKAPEEKERGITINASHVEFEYKGKRYSLVDCPGHADYIKNMIVGASGLNGAILVVSSSDGAMPQTKEHLLLAKQIGIPAIVVFINDKTVEGLDEEEKALLEEDIRDNLKQYGYDEEGQEKTPIVIGSALKALKGDKDESEKIKSLLEAIDTHIPLPIRDEKLPFLMYIEDVYVVKGQGPVATGRVKRGQLKVGDEIEIIGFGKKKKCVVKGLEMFKKSLDVALPGFDIGICLRGDFKDAKEEIKRGQVISIPGKVTVHKKFEAQSYILSKEERGRSTGFHTGYRPQFFISSIDVTGTVTLPDDKKVEPGSNIDFTVELMSNVVIQEGDKFIMREGGITVGQGIITKILE